MPNPVTTYFKDIATILRGAPAPVAAPKPKRSSKRAVMSQIANNRLTPAGWRNLTPLEQLLTSNYVIRERARELEKTNDFAEKFLLEFEANVPGPNGFTFQSYVRELVQVKPKVWQWQEDSLANNKIEEAFAEFSKPGNYTVTGTMGREETEALICRMWARDGEVFLRKIPFADAKFGMKLQVLEAELVDETLNTVNKTNGNIIKMGVEIDKYRRPVAYYIRKQSTASMLWGSFSYAGDHDVIPADQICHLFYQKYPNQTRGISLLVQSMVRMKRLSDYEEAVLVNAEISAKKMGFFSDKDGEAPEDLTVGAKVTETDEQGNEYDTGDQVMEVAAGSFEDIGGKQFTAFEPEFPTAQHESFFKTTTHGISAGLGASYSALTNDLGDTSYSSARVGLLNEREIWKMRQKRVINRVLNSVFESFLQFGILSGAIVLPFSKFEKFNKPVFIGRRWGWVDPLKDAMADALAVEYGFDTRTQILAEKGKDIQEVNAELAKEQADVAELGIAIKFNETLAKAAIDSGKEDSDGAKKSRDEEDELLARVAQILLSRKSNGHHKEKVAA
ncbi:MAG: phage portal protein [Bacteroidota bacterium]